ncbi:ankyrin repeat-containing domain protein [Flagelloscypha sp. PMI_526]|nr:ankyrin repeat-containing domain protein [Flagelloscypha sp. PMI_526]
MTIEQAIQSHLILEHCLFRSELWNSTIHQPCVELLNTALDEIVGVTKIETSLDAPFEETKNPKTKCFVCLINTISATTPRLIRNYRTRTRNPRCTIRQVIHATLSNQVQLPVVRIQGERFLCALDGHANPTHVLVKELGNAFAENTQVACLVNVGAGHPGVQPLTDAKNAEQLAGILRSCELVAEDVATQCHDLGPFFFRLTVSSGSVQESHILDDDTSDIIGLTQAYLSVDEISTRLDDLVESLRERFGVVSIERLSSIAAKDGQSRVATRLAKVEQHLDDSIFRNTNAWLQPIQQTSKLDASIRARSGTTCQWLLQNSTFLRWMKAKRGLFWLHGLMGTGKTVLSSFVIETLRTRDDIHVAYYYFEFTNPATLSEESLFRSLIVQLAAASSAVVRVFYQEHNAGGLQPRPSSLHLTLKHLVAASPKPIFIVVDALDELPPKQRKDFLKSLLDFCTSDSAARVHVMVTSREEVDIHRKLETVDFELSVQGDLVRQDIAAFVDRQLRAKKWTLWPPSEIEMMRHLLNERADGQFRMVACQMDILREAKSSAQLREALHCLPNSLSDTYDYILGKIPLNLRPQAHRLFTILAFSSTSISLIELSALLAVELGDEENWSDLPELRVANIFPEPLDVIDLGKSLVSQEEIHGFAFLQLSHASVKEYLLSCSGVWFSLDENLAHGMIARSCLALLLEFKILEEEDNFAFCPYSYSRDEWYTHILPNGSPQLLRQQQELYTSFPWQWSYYLDDLEYVHYDQVSSLASAAFFGLFDFLHTLLSSGSWDQDTLDRALAGGAASPQKLHSIPCCSLLISCGAQVNAISHMSVALSEAVKCNNHELVRYLVERGANVNIIGSCHGTPLYAAAEERSLDSVQYLVEQGAGVNFTCGGFGTALEAAARRRSLPIVQYLIEQGADANLTDGKHGTALQSAACARSLEMVHYLVGHGADVNAIEATYGNALKGAICGRSIGVIQYLVDKGADVNAFGGTNDSPLQVAAGVRSLEIVQYLVEKGASVNTTRGEFGSALQAAICYRPPETMDYRGMVAWDSRLDIVRYLVQHGADTNAIGGKYGTALQAAAYRQSLDVVRYLVGQGAKINTTGGRYGCALNAAVSGRSLEIVQYLVQHGADVNAIGGKYGTALHAVFRDLAIWGTYSQPLEAARCRSSMDIVQYLVEHGADVNAIGGKYGNALQAAVYWGPVDFVQFLVLNGANVNTIGGKFGTALDAATEAAKEHRSHLFSETIETT